MLPKYKYAVYFYGTSEVGNCKSEELEPYDDKTSAKFNTDRQMKKPEYKEAVEQIEAARSGNDPAPLESNDDELNKTDNENIKAEDISQDTEDFDPEESQLQIAEDVPKSTPVPVSKKRPANKPLTISPLISTTPTVPIVEQHDTKENDEKVSRSGRKIKEKKIYNDEIHPDEFFTQTRKRFKVDDSKTKSVPTTPVNDSVMNEFCINKMQILEDPVRSKFISTQFDLMKNIQEIKQALGLEQVEVDRALTAFRTLKEKTIPNVDQLMLLKYSQTIITIKRLRNYIGNINLWKLDEEPLNEFKEKAKEIRSIATEVYDLIKVKKNSLIFICTLNLTGFFFSFFSQTHPKICHFFNITLKNIKSSRKSIKSLMSAIYLKPLILKVERLI